MLEPVYGKKIEVFDHLRSGAPVVLPTLEPSLRDDHIDEARRAAAPGAG